MREMKDTGIRWINSIPCNWKLARIKDVISVLTDYTANGSFADLAKNVEYLDYEDFARLVRLTDLRENMNNMGVYVSEDSYKYLSKSALFGGEILVANVGAYAGLFCEMPPVTMPSTLGPNMFLIRTNYRMSEHFLFYMGNAKFVFEQLVQKGISSAQPKLNKTDVKTAYIVIPPLTEQCQIADFLDTKCAEIDALIADIQTQIDTLEQYKRSAITETVTKGLNSDAEMKDSGIPWVGMIPSAWKVMPNKYVMHKIKEICPVYHGEDILSLTMNGVNVRDLDAGGKMPSSFDGYQKIRAGNLLMCLFDIDVTPRCIGLIKTDGLVSPAYSQFVMHKASVAAYYYYYYLMVDFTKELLHMAKNLRHSLTEEQLGTISVPVPSVDEQKKIATFLDEKISEIDEIIAIKKEQLSVIDAYKKSLIFEYVTGKKEVPTAFDPC